MNEPPNDPASILGRLIFGEIDAKTAANELSTVTNLRFDGYYYWPADMYQSGHVSRTMAELKAELTKLGINVELPAA